MAQPNEVHNISSSVELLPKEGHVDLGRQVFLLLDAVLKDKTKLKLPPKWKRFHELSKNYHWRQTTDKANLVSANFLHTHRQRTVNMLTDNNPTFNVRKLAVDEVSEGISDLILRTSEYWWGETEQQGILEASVLNGETYGCCVEKIRFNPDAEYGVGEVETENVDPHHFGFYPPKSKDIQKAEAVFHFFPMSVRSARRKFPKFAKKIVADETYLNELGEDRREVTSFVDDKNNTSNNSSTNFGGSIRSLLSAFGSGFKKASDELLVVECWVKDFTMIEEKGPKIPDDPNDPNGAYTQEVVSVPKYKGYIRVVTAVNGHLVVSDVSNPSINHNLEEEAAGMTFLFDKFPFTLTVSNKDTSNAWGESDFEQLMYLQKEIDKSITQYSTLKDKVAGVKLINPQTSGVSNAQLATNGVGIIRPTSTIHGIQWMEPPPIPKDLVQSLEIFQQLFFTVAGSFDLENAQTPGKQVIAYKAIAALIERASTMLRGKIRNYSRMVRDRGRMYVSCMQNWYTTDRYISYDKDGEDITEVVNGNQLILPVRLSVVSGSTMPRSQVQEREEAIVLHERGAIDNEELLKKLDWPNWKEVVARMNRGPISEAAENWNMAGVPDEIIQFITQISSIDMKKLDRAIERGEVQSFEELFQIGGVEDQGLSLEDQKTEAEIEKIGHESDKVMAETKAVGDRVVIERDRVRNETAKTVAEVKKEKEIPDNANV